VNDVLIMCNSEVGVITTGGSKRCITVSTVREAEVFADDGFDDILLAAHFAHDKIPRQVDLQRSCHFTTWCLSIAPTMLLWNFCLSVCLIICLYCVQMAQRIVQIPSMPGSVSLASVWHFTIELSSVVR